MSIEGIKNAIVSAAQTTADGVKTAVVWCGHKISYCFNDVLVPFAKNAWEKISPVAKKAVEGLRTGFGIGSVLAATGLTVLLATHVRLEKETKLKADGVTPEGPAQKKVKDENEWDFARIGLTLIGAALIVSGVAVGAIWRTAKVI